MALTSKNYSPKDTEIAFFGGSFTAIDREYMLSLLSVASKYVKNGTVFGIRISTRPDCINDEILKTLKTFGVTAIELGAQSMSEDVLSLNERGHTVQDIINASMLIKKYGFELGLQMMTGLYGDTDDKAIYTVKEIIKLKPDTVRIYPTIVLKNTRLETLLKSGEYMPQELDSAVSLCTKIKEMFEKAGIRVIRLGLPSIDTDTYVAGPWHPAFAELCESEKYLQLILSELKLSGEYTIFVNGSELSKAIGQKQSNIKKLSDMGFQIKIFPRNDLKKYEIKAIKS